MLLHQVIETGSRRVGDFAGLFDAALGTLHQPPQIDLVRSGHHGPPMFLERRKRLARAGSGERRRLCRNWCGRLGAYGQPSRPHAQLQGQMLKIELGRGGSGEAHPFEDIDQFPDVSRPVIDGKRSTTSGATPLIDNSLASQILARR